MRGTRRSALLAIALSFALIGASCAGDDDGDDSGQETTETTQAEEAVKGGTLVIGAEQEPDCADWISSCAGASWGIWVMGAHTMPRAFTPNYEDGGYDITPLLAEEPELDEGPPMKVTYQINEDAVWSDGTPITSADFQYTWDQVKNGTDIYDKTGYELIESVDATEPKTAVVTFEQPYAAWRDLFGGFYGIYPKHLLDGKDRNAEMKDGYKFSGGPWLIENWAKGQEVRLVPNPEYWGDKPNLDAVVFRFIPDTAAEIEAFKTGQVTMIYPQAQLELAGLKGQPDTAFDVITGMNYEAVWLNAAKKPLDSKAVRQALAYATDRQAIVDTLFKPVQEDIEPINALMSSANTDWYSEPFAKYTRDLEKVNELMEGDGWTKGSDGIWAKGGQRAVIENSTTAGNKRRELTQELLQSQWKEAGFEMTITNTRAATLFGEWGPQGVFTSAVYAQVPPSPDPGICNVFCSKNIPTTASPNGQNWTRLASDAIDEPWLAQDVELDVDKRKELVDEGQAALAEEVPAIPVDPFPDVIIYNSAKLNGPIDHQLSFSPFHNMNLWWCTGGAC